MIAGVAAAVVAGFFTLSNTVLDHSLSGGDEPGGKQTTAAAAPTPGKSSDAKAPIPSSPAGSSPSASHSPQAPEKSYALVYRDRRVSVSLPDGYGVSTLDLDVPTVKNYSKEDDYFAEREDAKTGGESVAPDLLYSGPVAGDLAVEEGRQAAQLDAPLPTTPEQCAAEAVTGGFDSLSMETWPLETKSGFCLITDQGNVARVVINRFVGGTRSRNSATGDAPERIEFTATLWRAS
ncbi:hypothetical protein SHJG_p269 (plasmid) [Streptomyces hygroscopicus subsp. jinggangensis 5008]|nr:hypothetical protein SHJG_p269 [Streptomyces hygroscopicus subsp. jinggangensis 5008]AGF68538.1 hypothetical protein SHJGH_p269 [Streptomyces hygroscopicus subsp. jinggangensis TL01]